MLSAHNNKQGKHIRVVYLSFLKENYLFVCIHVPTSPIMCSTRRPRASPLGSELRLLAVGVLLGVDGGQ